MRFTTVTNVYIDPLPATPYQVRLEWRYQNQPFSWHIASYSATVNPSGTLLSPLTITYDETIDVNIQVKATMLGCSNAQPYYFDYAGAPVTTTSTTSTTTAAPIIFGNVNAVLANVDDVAGSPHLQLTFGSPTPGPMHFRWGYDITHTSGPYNNVSVTYPPVHTFPIDGGCVPYNYVDIRMDLTIPAGTTTFNVPHFCTGQVNNTTPNYISKVVFYFLSVPAPYSLQLTPTRGNLSFEIR
jgi:hypothetical protein